MLTEKGSNTLLHVLLNIMTSVSRPIMTIFLISWRWAVINYGTISNAILAH